VLLLRRRLLLLLLQKHVQKSVPILLGTHTALEAAAAELQVCLQANHTISRRCVRIQQCMMVAEVHLGVTTAQAWCQPESRYMQWDVYVMCLVLTR
jgi:hypothetical protein